MRRIAFLTAAAAAIVAVAAPAVAQPYPGQTPQPYPGQPGYGYPGQVYPQGQAYPQSGYPQTGYPQTGYPQPGYGQPQQGGIAGLINGLLGGRTYAANDQQGIAQCVAAAQTEVARRYPSNYRPQAYTPPGYPQQQPGYGYNQAGSARVTAISSVERRNRNLRVVGTIDSGTSGYARPPYGNAYGYDRNQAYAQRGDMQFNCTVDYAGRVTNLRLSRTR